MNLKGKHEVVIASQASLNALALGYDLEHRAIHLFGDIDKNSAYRFISGFKFLDRSEGVIHILISSEGGDADAGMAIYETIRTANNPTIVEALGIVASAAVPILLAGTVRFLNPETRVMVHDVSLAIDGDVSTPVLASVAKDADSFNQRYHEIIAERTNRSIKDVEKWCAAETSFWATEAIKNGFADRVLETRPLPKSYEDALKEIQGLIVVDTRGQKRKTKRKDKK
jgi:ATP-dependent Clp protease protease subunit